MFSCWFAAGCARFEYNNTANVFDKPFVGHDEKPPGIWLKSYCFYPARDLLTLDWAWRALHDKEAMNITPDGDVADGPFFTNRNIKSLSPDAVRIGPATEPPPQGPWRVRKVKHKGRTPGFIGEDATGRTWLVKLDHPRYPEMGTSAEMIGSRLTWLMGYHVPAIYLVQVDGTGFARYDGKRATASLFVPGRVVGGFKFDHYRMRREVRGLRLVAAWTNDVDRGDNNTLVAVENGAATCYLVDFNSCFGSWNGRPKAAWRGHRYALDMGHLIVKILTLGILPRIPPAGVLQSRAVGHVSLLDLRDAATWKSENPNTAFERLTQADAAWMGRRIAAASDEQLTAAVAAAEFSSPADSEWILAVLRQRRRHVLRAWKLEGLLE